eukprot:GFUD01023662.1.p1 GENE.GFUD01023662.1~~GFUD01023662.1.p1  ORF type:complete len:448 (-),score=72.60 GFUD01023662.1:29-1372(-)
MSSDSESDSGFGKIPSRCASVNLYRCSELGCDKTFTRPSRLETHLLSHTGERPFKCDQCDKDFTRNAHLKRHTMLNHHGIKQTSPSNLICDQCDSRFANQYSLKKHVKRFHKVKQYPCDVCGKSFHKHHLLKSHSIEHTGDPSPFRCNQCGKSFPYLMYLKRHERVHKGYVCEICDLTLEKWTDLHQHTVSEHPPPSKPIEILPCDQCDKTFQNKVFLKKHKLVHSESRDTFHCPMEFCPRFFYFKNNLSQHIKGYHEGLKYLCSQSGCAHKFYSKQRLLDHLQNSHHNVYEAQVKKKKKAKQVKKRKDRGAFKKPMAAILTGVDCSIAGGKTLLQDENRPLDSLDRISEEVNDFIYNTSEASDSEVYVGCKRGSMQMKSDLLEEEFADPNLILGSLKRMEKDKHFKRVRIEDSDLSSDTDCDVSPKKLPALNEPKRVFDFSKFLKN